MEDIIKIGDDIKANPGRQYTVKQAASDYGIPLRTLKTEFRKTYGVSFYIYLRNCRMEAACGLLQDTDLSVDAIALKAGYKNTNKFVSVFRKMYGITPEEYRQGSC